MATLFLVRAGQVDDTFALAEILRADDEHFVQTAVGGLLREAGKRDPERLRAFLDAYAADLSAHDAAVRDREARRADARALPRDEDRAVVTETPAAREALRRQRSSWRVCGGVSSRSAPGKRESDQHTPSSQAESDH